MSHILHFICFCYNIFDENNIIKTLRLIVQRIQIYLSNFIVKNTHTHKMINHGYYDRTYV